MKSSVASKIVRIYFLRKKQFNRLHRYTDKLVHLVQIIDSNQARFAHCLGIHGVSFCKFSTVTSVFNNSNQCKIVRKERYQYRKLKIYLDVALIVPISHGLLITNRYVTVIAGNSLCVRSEIPCVLDRLKYAIWLNNRNRFNYKKRF